MKLLTILPGFATGGAENMVYELCKQLGKKDIDNYILCYCGKQNTALESKVEKVAKVTYLNCSGTVNIKNIRAVIRLMDEIAPDVVHAHMGGALFASIWTLIRNKPLVVTIHTTPQKAFSSKIENLLYLRALFGKFQMVAVSQENKRLADSYYHMKQECLCVNNGVDLERFYSTPHKGFTLINVARQDDNKNQWMLIEAFAELRKQNHDMRLILLGDGPNHDALKRRCIELGIGKAVSLPGSVSNAEKYYAVADVYVQTSHREAMPLSILEAMAAGLPIVSTNVGGIKDVVKKNGILVLDNDFQGLLVAIRTIMMANSIQKKEYASESIKLVQDYSSEKMSEKYLAIYRML